MNEAWIVLDLAFGDSGKGTVVDWLTRTRGARLIVRWNGGAQAGHTVVAPDGRRHVFAQFGAGSFVPGVRTYLARDVVVHPTALLVEARRLQEVGVPDALQRLSIADRARIVTPFHQAAGRLRELARGPARHGSCGVGIGEAVRDALDHPEDAIRARDLAVGGADLRRKTSQAQQRLHAEFRGFPDGTLARTERAMLEDPNVVDRWLEAIRPVGPAVVEEALHDIEGTVVFEGAQGVLLDEWRGFHPHTTWSTCTGEGTESLLSKFDGPVRRLGVLRTYLTRHGEGPFPTESPELAVRLPEPHLQEEGGWPRPFRVGWPDLVLARYALVVCPVDGLAITHLDRISDLWKSAIAYRVAAEDADLFSQDGSAVVPSEKGNLARQERLTQALQRVVPILAEVTPAEVLPWTEDRLSTPIWLSSSGTQAAQKRGRGALQ